MTGADIESYLKIRRRTILQQLKAFQEAQRALSMELSELERVLKVDNARQTPHNEDSRL